MAVIAHWSRNERHDDGNDNCDGRNDHDHCGHRRNDYCQAGKHHGIADLRGNRRRITSTTLLVDTTPKITATGTAPPSTPVVVINVSEPTLVPVAPGSAPSTTLELLPQPTQTAVFANSRSLNWALDVHNARAVDNCPDRLGPFENDRLLIEVRRVDGSLAWATTTLVRSTGFWLGSIPWPGAAAASGPIFPGTLPPGDYLVTPFCLRPQPHSSSASVVDVVTGRYETKSMTLPSGGTVGRPRPTTRSSWFLASVDDRYQEWGDDIALIGKTLLAMSGTPCKPSLGYASVAILSGNRVLARRNVPLDEDGSWRTGFDLAGSPVLPAGNRLSVRLSCGAANDGPGYLTKWTAAMWSTAVMPRSWSTCTRRPGMDWALLTERPRWSNPAEAFQKIPDLLVAAAAAEAHNLTVLHYDAHFDLIGSVTGQPSQWVVPPGTVH